MLNGNQKAGDQMSRDELSRNLTYVQPQLQQTTWERQNLFVIAWIRYNMVNLCNKCSFGTDIFVRYTRVSQNVTKKLI